MPSVHRFSVYHFSVKKASSTSSPLGPQGGESFGETPSATAAVSIRDACLFAWRIPEMLAFLLGGYLLGGCKEIRGEAT